MALSHGAAIAIEYAARHPERVGHLISPAAMRSWIRGVTTTAGIASACR